MNPEDEIRREIARKQEKENRMKDMEEANQKMIDEFFKKTPLEYSIVEHASQIAEDKEEYLAGNMTSEEQEVFHRIFDSKIRDKNDTSKEIRNPDLRMFNIELVKLFGLEEAIFISQLRWRLKGKRARIISDQRGKWWAFYNSYDEWLESLPMFSLSTLRRMIAKLEKLEIIFTKRTPYSKYYGLNTRAIVYYVRNPEDYKKRLSKLL